MVEINNEIFFKQMVFEFSIKAKIWNIINAKIIFKSYWEY